MTTPASFPRLKLPVSSLFASRREIRKRARTVATRLSALIPKNVTPVFLPILNGGLPLAMDLLREWESNLGRPATLDMIRLQSYGNRRSSSGTVECDLPPKSDLSEATVVLIDDILDSGETIAAAQDVVLDACASRIFTVVAVGPAKGFSLILPENQLCLFPRTSKDWLIGYGMDHQGVGRGLSSIWISPPQPE